MRACLLIIFIIILSSCKTTSNQISNNQKKLIISLEKTACFGTCPILKIEIYNNGAVVYNGIKHVKRLGIHDFEIQPKEIKKILSKAKEIGFYNLENEYTERISDLPTTYIMINGKLIKDYFGAPKKLKNLETLIEKKILDLLEVNSF